MISHKYRCIYIHIPKTAGTSIMSKLGSGTRTRGSQDHRSIRNIEDSITPGIGKAVNPYVWARVINQRYRGKKRDFDFVTQDQYNQYFKFSFVRNPWSRVYSWYKNVVRDEVHQAEHGISGDCRFDEFITHHLDSWALRSQLSWIRNEKGKIAVDFIGRFETLEKDFRRVCSELGIGDWRLPQHLKSGNEDYRTIYTTKTKNLVHKCYREEIDYFKYDFDVG